jgi:hypothetical protein
MPMAEWKKQQDAFLAARETLARQARQRLALQMICNADIDELLALDAAGRMHMCRRLTRLIERERLKGARGHWSYDLNRHIGLKQALDTLRAAPEHKGAA